MAVVVLTVLAQNMCHDFDECINFLRQYIVKCDTNLMISIAMAAIEDKLSSTVPARQEELNVSALIGAKRKLVDDEAGQPLLKVENHCYKKNEFHHLLKAGLGDKLRKISEAAKEKDDAMDHKKLTTGNDDPGNKKKMCGRKGKTKDAKGSGD